MILTEIAEPVVLQTSLILSSAVWPGCDLHRNKYGTTAGAESIMQYIRIVNMIIAGELVPTITGYTIPKVM